MPRHTPDRAKLGRVLRHLRDTAGLTQEQLGYRARLHRNYVGSAERGERNVSFDALNRWLSALEITWADFGAALDRPTPSSRPTGRSERPTAKRMKANTLQV